MQDEDLRQLHRAICEHIFETGYPPTTRELVWRLHWSRASVREGLSKLAWRGVIEISHRARGIGVLEWCADVPRPWPD